MSDENRKALSAWFNAVTSNSSAQVAFGIVLLALVIAVVAQILDAEAKEIVAVATAIAGLSTIAVGLALAKDAFKLLYDKQEHEKAKQGQPTQKSALQNVAANIQAIPGAVAIDLNELLPKLITTAAGLSVAVLLFGVLLLAGASFATPTTTSPPPTSSSTTTTATTTQSSTTTK
jgi:hypothetical protein